MGKAEKRVVKTTDGKDMSVVGYTSTRLRCQQKIPNPSYCQVAQSPVSQFFSYCSVISIDGSQWLRSSSA
jgi:hypothetical protein